MARLMRRLKLLCLPASPFFFGELNETKYGSVAEPWCFCAGCGAKQVKGKTGNFPNYFAETICYLNSVVLSQSKYPAFHGDGAAFICPCRDFQSRRNEDLLELKIKNRCREIVNYGTSHWVLSDCFCDGCCDKLVSGTYGESF